MRIVFIGAVEFSQSALVCLIGMGADIVGVCTVKESHDNADHCDLSTVCESHRIPWRYAPDINSDELLQWMAGKRPDVIFCFGWSRLLRRNTLNLAPLGVVGYHPTALPANRGRHPLIWALVLGLKETASTFFFMDEGVDRGPILSQEKIEIEVNDNAATLYAKVTRCALRQIQTFVPQLVSGRFPQIVQDEQRANVWRKRGKADGQIDWRMPAQGVHNLVRGLTRPYVGAHFLYRGQEVKVWSTELVFDLPPNVEPGKIVDVTDSRAIIKCGEYGIRLCETDPVFTPAAGEYL
jgi:methionyl-tRNA formyltransferase